MSLKAFHLFFIALSVLLAVFVAAWATGQYRLEHEIEYIATTVGAIAAGAGLAVYGAKFQRRAKHL